jgi:hypothetical protein
MALWEGQPHVGVLGLLGQRNGHKDSQFLSKHSYSTAMGKRDLFPNTSIVPMHRGQWIGLHI